MVYLEIALIAYVIDLIFGEFKITHPVVLMGNYIKWFESKFYRDSVFAGATLALSLVLIVGVVSFYLETILLSLGSFGVLAAAGLGSMAIANNMLYESVKRVIYIKLFGNSMSQLFKKNSCIRSFWKCKV
jgi:adenosylcobinamide-phosphate synthase